MAFEAGNFTASELQAEVQAKIDILATDTTQKHLIKETSIINELYTQPNLLAQTPEQQAFFSDARRCADLKVSWLSDGDTAEPVEAGTTPFCDPDGPEIGSDSVTYPKPGGIEKTFKVLTDVCKNKFSFAEKVAYAMMSKRALLVDYLEKQGIAFTVSNADDLTGITPPKGAVAGSIWNIGAIDPAADSREAVKDLIHVSHFAQDQRMISPVMLMGNRFRYEDALFQATAGQLNTVDGFGSLLTRGVPIVRDVFNLDAATTSQDILLVDRRAVSYINYTWAQNTQARNEKMMLNHPVQYYINDPVIRVWDPVKRAIVPFKWDITAVWKCNEYNQYAVVYTITARGGYLKMPKDATNKPQIAHIKFA